MPLHRWDAVIFDYGRVLSHSPTPSELEQLAALAGVSQPRFYQIYSDTRKDYDRGHADHRQHWRSFADVASVEISPEQVEHIASVETRMWLRVNPQMLALARETKARGLQIAILSNMPHDLLARLRAEFRWLDEFEVQIWSCELGVIKPDPGIYRACLSALGCEPSRSVFFDDRPDNVEAARTLGMEAHVFESAGQARAIVRAGLNLNGF